MLATRGDTKTTGPVSRNDAPNDMGLRAWTCTPRPRRLLPWPIRRTATLPATMFPWVTLRRAGLLPLHHHGGAFHHLNLHAVCTFSANSAVDMTDGSFFVVSIPNSTGSGTDACSDSHGFRHLAGSILCPCAPIRTPGAQPGIVPDDAPRFST